MTRPPRTPSENRLASHWDRLNGRDRFAGIDLARGLAVLGMFAAHLLWIDESFDVADPATWIDIVNGRSSILFATLAGVSIGLVSGGATPVIGAELLTTRGRLAVRAVALWAIGALLIATGVPVYVILPAYAMLFLLALPLLPLGARILLPLAGAVALLMPFVQQLLDGLPFWNTPLGDGTDLLLGWHYPFPVWAAFLIAGMGLARLGMRRFRVQLGMLVVGALLAAVGYGVHLARGADTASDRPSLWSAVWTADAHSSGLLEVIGTGGFAIAVIGACLLVCRTPMTWAVLPLRAVGAMPLSAYVTQLVLWAIVAAAVLEDTGDLAGFRDLDPFVPLALGTLVACTAWALLIGRGPLEWALDRLARLIAPSSKPSP